MTNQQMLTKAIERAVERGWKPHWGTLKWKVLPVTNMIEVDSPTMKDFPYHTVEVIYHHDFAKAYWGEEYYDEVNEFADYIDRLTRASYEGWPMWQYHLQQCVLSENPIKYYYDYDNE